jgi:hypothetical protein
MTNPAMTNPAMTGGRDDTTRYLCAAAHLDENFADQAIREYLVEPTRAVPPSPGVYAPAVLAEAVAARARRKLRDGALLALALLALVCTPWSLLGAWFVVALVVLLVSTHSGDWLQLARKLVPLVIGLAIIWFVVSPLVAYLSAGGESSDFGELDAGAGEQGSPDVARTVLSIVAILGMAAVLLVDEFVVARHIDNRFRRGRRIGEVVVRADQRQVFAFAPNRSLAQLIRHLAGPQQPMAPGRVAHNGDRPPPPASVIVSHGYNPFVGAGEPHEPWSLAIPLEPQSADTEPVPLTAADLYRRICVEVAALREAANLSPGRRFAELRISEQIVVSADELVDHDDEPTARDFLAGHTVAPYPLLRGERARELRDDPFEWARYHLCFQLETWDRDFIVSAYVHVAVNDRTLYVEWTPCVLLPIRAQFRRIDARSLSPWPTVRAALGALVGLPTTLPRRIRGVFARIRPLPRQRGVISSGMFGARRSLRELAADTEVHNYFQLADQDRYVKVLESRLTLAIIDELSAAGYSVAALEKRVEAVSNSNMFINSPIIGSVFGGRGNSVSGTTAGNVGAGAAK